MGAFYLGNVTIFWNLSSMKGGVYMKILVVDKAKIEIEKLQHFVNLAESYQPINARTDGYSPICIPW